MSLKKRAVIVVIVSLGAILGVVGWTRHGLTAGARTAQPTTAAVDRGPIVARVTATGTLSALVTVQVGAQVSGRVERLLVDYNATVRKGQVIARIDPKLFDAAVQQARANLQAADGNHARAEAQARDAQRQLGRQRELAARQLADGDLVIDILAQFLVEAVSLSLVGGVVGVAAGLLGAAQLAASFGWPMRARPDVIVVAVGFSALVGIGFGLYPAHKASRLDPIDALRYE
jgi:hypothetical protein